MGTRRPVRAVVTAVVIAVFGVLLPMTSGPAVAGGSALGRDTAAEVIASYRARIPQLMAEQDIPGLSVVLVDGDTVVWQEGFGLTDRGGGRPVTADTIFSVQSMSKTFTATAVMQAVQAGLLDLDVPITTFLPGFRVHSAFESHPEQRITLRTLLSCTAGFTHEAPLGNNYEPEVGDFDSHVKSISDTWLRFPVGTGYAYSNQGIDLAGYILQEVSGKPFPVAVRDSLLGPLGMDRSTFDRDQVDATDDRAVGHSTGLATPRVNSPMTAAGGLWASAADLAKFLRFQLGNGTFEGRTMLDTALVQEMRTVPPPDAGARAGYALGVVRTPWRPAHHSDLFSHGGGGEGFLADLWWAPQMQLGIAVLTNSDTHDLQVGLAMGIMTDLVTTEGSVYRDRMLALPVQSDAIDPDGKFVAPPDLSDRIAALALPSSSEQSARWDGYSGFYRAGQLGAIDPTKPASRFHVDSGAPFFDASEDGTPVRHRLTEVQPGLFLAENGETLDLRAPSRQWRGIDLHPVTNGPLTWQWALLAAVAFLAVAWIGAGITMVVSPHRRPGSRSTARAGIDRSGGGPITTTVAATGALSALATVVALRSIPALVDVGFLGAVASPVPIRLAFHLPLLVTLLAAALAALLAVGAIRHWWTPRVRRRDAALLIGLAALVAQLGSWHLIGWGF